MKISPLCVLPCALYGLVHLTTVGAQENKRASILEEVIVTAQKRTENLQEVPIAVTALTSEMRELTGITTIEDITNAVPGLTYEGQLDRASIRGVGRVVNAPGTDPGVGLYVDGVYSSSNTSAGRSSIFTDRIEVLRGPQGSLYGRNTTGGAINTISRGTKDTFGGEARAIYGSFDRKGIEATATGPITDWFRVRLTGSYIKQDGGYFNNHAEGYPDEGGTADNKDYEVLFDLDLGESVDFSFRYTRRDTLQLDRFSTSFGQPGYQCQEGPPLCTATRPAPAPAGSPVVNLAGPSATVTFNGRAGFVPSSLFNGYGVTAATRYFERNPATPNDPREFIGNVPTERASVSNGYSPTVVWHLPFMAADLKWIGGYTEYEYYSLSDALDNIAREYYDYQPMNATGTAPLAGTSPVRIHTGQHLRFEEDKEYYSNDLTLTSTGDGAVNYVVGLYQYHERYEQVPILQGFVNPQQSQLQTVYARPAVFPASLGPQTAFGANVAQQLAAYNAMTQVAYTNPDGAYQKVLSEVKADSYAAYGQVDWEFADHWKFSLGGRYSIDKKSGTEARRTVIWDPSVVGAAAKAFDNSAPLDCFVPAGARNSTDPTYDRVIDKATGQEIALPITTGNYMSSCRSREFAEREWSEFTPSAVLEWTPMEDFLTYAKYSEGYKSGALRIANFDIDSETKPEHLNAYEIGAKVTLASRYQFNASVFYYDYTDYQFPVTRRIPQEDGTTVSIREYANIDAMSGGAELEATLVPIDPLTITLSYSYLTTETTSDLFLLDGADPLALSNESTYPDVLPVNVGTTGLTGVPVARGVGNVFGTEQTPGYAYYQNAKGGTLPNSPKHKASAGIMYNLEFAAGTLVPSIRYSWRDAVSSAGLSISPLSRRTNSTNSYGTGDATITWIDTEGRYRIIGAVANMFDDQTANSATRDVTDVLRLNLNPPRTWSLTFQYNFGSERR